MVCVRRKNEEWKNFFCFHPKSLRAVRANGSFLGPASLLSGHYPSQAGRDNVDLRQWLWTHVNPVSQRVSRSVG